MDEDLVDEQTVVTTNGCDSSSDTNGVTLKSETSPGNNHVMPTEHSHKDSPQYSAIPVSNTSKGHFTII